MNLEIVLMLGSAGLTPAELGRAVEERGFDFVALSAAAAVTSGIKLRGFRDRAEAYSFTGLGQGMR